MPHFALLRKAPRGTLRTFVTGDGAPHNFACGYAVYHAKLFV